MAYLQGLYHQTKENSYKEALSSYAKAYLGLHSLILAYETSKTESKTRELAICRYFAVDLASRIRYCIYRLGLAQTVSLVEDEDEAKPIDYPKSLQSVKAFIINQNEEEEEEEDLEALKGVNSSPIKKRIFWRGRVILVYDQRLTELLREEVEKEKEVTAPLTEAQTANEVVLASLFPDLLKRWKQMELLAKRAMELDQKASAEISSSTMVPRSKHIVKLYEFTQYRLHQLIVQQSFRRAQQLSDAAESGQCFVLHEKYTKAARSLAGAGSSGKKVRPARKARWQDVSKFIQSGSTSVQVLLGLEIIKEDPVLLLHLETIQQVLKAYLVYAQEQATPEVNNKVKAFKDCLDLLRGLEKGSDRGIEAEDLTVDSRPLRRYLVDSCYQGLKKLGHPVAEEDIVVSETDESAASGEEGEEEEESSSEEEEAAGGGVTATLTGFLGGWWGGKK